MWFWDLALLAVWPLKSLSTMLGLGFLVYTVGIVMNILRSKLRVDI
jgi:hypothetical protein